MKGFTRTNFVKQNLRGFTLVEILVVIAVVSIVGTILAAIFINTLRGSNKSQILASIKQNGQAVLENMDKTIRGADNVICPALGPLETTKSSNTLVVLKNGCYTRYRFDNDKGRILQDNPQPDSSTSCITNPPSPTPKVIKTFINDVCNDEDLVSMNSANILTDTNLQSGVSVSVPVPAGGMFTRNRQAGLKDSITVTFALDHGISAPSSVAGQIDPVVFTTTIGLR